MMRYLYKHGLPSTSLNAFEQLYQIELFLQTICISLYDCGIIQQVYTERNIVSTQFSQLLCKVHSFLKITSQSQIQCLDNYYPLFIDLEQSQQCVNCNVHSSQCIKMTPHSDMRKF